MVEEFFNWDKLDKLIHPFAFSAGLPPQQQTGHRSRLSAVTKEVPVRKTLLYLLAAVCILPYFSPPCFAIDEGLEGKIEPTGLEFPNITFHMSVNGATGDVMVMDVLSYSGGMTHEIVEGELRSCFSPLTIVKPSDRNTPALAQIACGTDVTIHGILVIESPDPENSALIETQLIDLINFHIVGWNFGALGAAATSAVANTIAVEEMTIAHEGFVRFKKGRTPSSEVLFTYTKKDPNGMVIESSSSRCVPVSCN